MDNKSILFYLFSVVLLFSGFRVISARNPVHAALFLVLSFCTAACLWMLLKAEFLAISLVLVYVGAVMVLFLFVVMMLDIDLAKLRQGFWGVFPLAMMIGIVIVVQIVMVLKLGFQVTAARPMMTPPLSPQAIAAGATADKIDNTKALGIALYDAYLYPTQIAAVLLLVAILAAIALTLRRRKDSKYQNPADQVRVKAKDRVRIVKMAPTLKEGKQ